MLYALAMIGAATVALLLWRAFGPEREPEQRQPVLGPEDDPDFLRDLERRRRDSDGSSET